MSLNQLGILIHDALLKWSESKVPTDGSIPIRRQEFSDLVRLMEAKAEAQKGDFTVPTRPAYDGPHLHGLTLIMANSKPRAGRETR
jgi:hypothetical protein